MLVEPSDARRAARAASTARLVLPPLIVDARPVAVARFLEFFAARLGNRRTHAAYGRAVGQFLAWCEARGLALAAVAPLHVAAYIRTHPGSAPTVKQHLAAIRMLGDWLVVSQVLPVNPAAAVRGPKHVVTNGATPVLSPAEARRLLKAIDTGTLDSSFCVEALHEALDRYGSPEIFNTDQGSQFTSLAFTDGLTDAGIHISMDGKGRWMDNVFIERLWRSLKYEQVYLAEYATASDARAGIGWWIECYNERRPHSSLVDRTPNEAYTLGAIPGPGRYPAPSQPEAA